MKLCIVQNTHMKNARENISKTIQIIPEAIKQGADMICFSEWFLGTNPPDQIPNKFTQILSDYAKKDGKVIVTGNFRIQIDAIGKKFKQVSIVIDKKGEIVLVQQKVNLYKGEKPWFVSGNKVSGWSMENGNIAVTSGLDSIDEAVYSDIKEIKPYLWLAQANEHVFDPNIPMYEQLVEIVKKRSIELSCIIAVPMILGGFYGCNYHGKSFIVKNGEVVASMDDKEGLLFYDV